MSTSPPVPPSGERDKHNVVVDSGLTWRRRQNRKHTTYCTFVRRGPNHGHRYNVYIQKIWWNLDMWFLNTPADRTDIQTHRQAHCNTSHRMEAKWEKKPDEQIQQQSNNRKIRWWLWHISTTIFCTRNVREDAVTQEIRHRRKRTTTSIYVACMTVKESSNWK